MVPDNKLGAWEIVFASEPEWLPEQVRFIVRYKEPLPKDGKITVEQVGQWTPVAKTTTSWKKHPDLPYWLPSSVRMEATENGMDQTREFVFDNWQFGEDVDSELLKKSNSTPELIQQQVDFKAIIDEFERYGPRANKRNASFDLFGPAGFPVSVGQRKLCRPEVSGGFHTSP